MGTRSLTKVIETYQDDKGKEIRTPIICMYKQYDGYLEGYGQELAEFLSPFYIVNGMSLKEERQIANGIGCLSAQLVSHFKNEAGGIYLYPPDSEDCGEEYTYLIEENKNSQITIKILDYDKENIFEGTPEELLTHINDL